MTAPDLDALAALLAKATPGPWTAGEPIIGIPRFIVADCGPTGKVYPATNEVSHGTTSMDDAKLIAAAVNALPALIARVRELERQRKPKRDLSGSTHWDIAEVGAVCHDECAIAQIKAAALAMRERCAQACESVTWPDSATWARDFAAAIRALEA